MNKLFKKLSLLFLSGFGVVISNVTAPDENAFSAKAESGDLHERTNKTTIDDRTPEITILTHGLGGHPDNWSNAYNGTKGSINGFEEDPDSLIEQIKSNANGGINLYQATPSNIYEGYDSSNKKSYTDLAFDKHTVIVPDIYTYSSLKEVYDSFHTIVDKVVEQFVNYSDDGHLPKLNLIGHSMGGIINMIYTIEHPKNVSSLISLGTPYNGSWYDNDFVQLVGISSFNDQPCICGTCNHYDYKYCDLDERRNAWNEMYAENPQIKFYAFSGEMSVDIWDYIFDSGLISQYYNFFADLGANLFLDHMVLGPYFLSVFPGDICVDVSSQRATGYNGVTNFHKVFTTGNSNMLKVSQDNMPVAHNLEARDADFIKIILSLIEFGNDINTNSYLENGLRIKLLSKLNEKWVFLAKNERTQQIEIDYNSNLCFVNDGLNWNGLGHINTTKKLQPGEFAIIQVSNFGTADAFALSYTDDTNRYIVCANSLNSTNLTMNCRTNTKTYQSYVKNNMKVAILSKYFSEWIIKLTNTGIKKSFCYNSNMCFLGDAKNWSGLYNVVKTKELENNESTIIKISEYGTATSIAISYTSGSYRYIFSADNLSTSGSLSPYATSTTNYTYTSNGMKISILGKHNSSWLVDITNLSGAATWFEFNSKMCFSSDAKNWVNLTDIKTTVPVPKNGTVTVKIYENFMATSIAISRLDNNARKIVYADNLNMNGYLSGASSTMPVYNYCQYGIKVNIVGKNGSTWKIRITNLTQDDCTFYYNSKMCFESDAKNWSGLINVKHTDVVATNGIVEVDISENGTAGAIAISYVDGGYRYIFYANNLSTKGSLKDYSNCIDSRVTEQYGMQVHLLGKDGSTWLVQLTNNTGEGRTFYYNNKMCFEGDAKNWTGLKNVREIYLEEGQTCPYPLKISENGTATHIAISYEENNRRYVFYANGLSTNGSLHDRGAIIAPALEFIMKGKSGSTWTVDIRNNTNATRVFYYNKKMCFEADASSWSGLNDLDSFELSNGNSKTVYISENGTATDIVCSYVEGNTRNIFRSNKLSSSSSGKPLKTYRNVMPFNEYEQNGIRISILGKYMGTWIFELTNKTGTARTFDYNSKMCFESDAKNWTGLTDFKTTPQIANGKTEVIRISENGTATDIAISYTNGSTRYIFYAHNLSISSFSMYSYSNSKAFNKYTVNGITASILGKTGSTWTIQVTNNTGSTRAIEYNSKMCFEGDAKGWSGLSNKTQTKSLSNGESTNISISENGFATDITLSYTNGNYRYVFYANNLSASGTMSAKGNTIDLSLSSSQCVTEGTLITLADGTQKPVEELTGEELLLVWNLETGSYDYAPILFIDSDPEKEYEVIKLTFSDGTTVNVVSEHGFYDVDLNKYVYLDRNAANFIGHNFIKQDGDGYETVTLTNVDISYETTTTYSPVTYKHLCYYVNGMLSMPGGIDGMFNYFDVDSETMKYDEEAMANDIATYGLLTYEELCEFAPVSREMFEAVNGQYLKIALGKGLITLEDIQYLADRYSSFVPEEEEVTYTDEEIRNHILEVFEENGTSLENVMKQYIRNLSHNYFSHISHSVFEKAVWEVSYDGTYFYAKVTVKWHGANYIFNIKVA